MAKIIINVTKENGVIILTTDDNKTIKVDCINYVIKSYTGRSVIKFPVGVTFSENVKKYNVLYGLNELCRSKIVQKRCALIEQLWNDLDIVEEIPNTEKIPAGYIKFCRENEKEINNNSLNDFLVWKTFKNVSEKDKELYMSIYDYIKDIYHQPTIELIATIAKIYKSTLKSNHFNVTLFIGSYLNDFVYKCRDIKVKYKNINIMEVIDTNRDFDTNITLLKNAINKSKEKAIIEKEDKIRGLTTLDLGEYFVIVPQTLEDFSNEGKMQNNCVGYYYHDSIKEGKNLIYFIRTKENPSKSYITCRYSISSEKTVEHRIKNNVNYNYDEMLAKIDERIKELLTA